MALRIFVADDHEVVRRGICALLTAHHGWEICGEAADGREAVEKVNHLQPDIVILDIGMPALNGLEAARQILHNNSHQKIAILSITDSEQVIQEALRAGAKAYILKSDGAKDLILEHRQDAVAKNVYLTRPDGSRAGDRAIVGGR